MEERAGSRRRWTSVVVVVIAVLTVAGGCGIFLVLTGIIAEPETVIENIIRALSAYIR